MCVKLPARAIWEIRHSKFAMQGGWDGSHSGCRRGNPGFRRRILA
jgi:hypothetical protein